MLEESEKDYLRFDQEMRENAKRMDEEMEELIKNCDQQTIEEMLATFEANERDELASDQNDPNQTKKSTRQNVGSGKSKGSSHFRIRI
jgi:molecular chaperone GrpE (heat shock protein)